MRPFAPLGLFVVLALIGIPLTSGPSQAVETPIPEPPPEDHPDCATG